MIDRVTLPSGKLVEVRTARGFKLIRVSKILFIKAVKKNSVIHLDDETEINTNHLLKWYDRVLSAPHFFRCHKTFIINCGKIDCYCNNYILMMNNHMIPFSRNRKEAFKSTLKNYEGVFSS